MTDFKHKVGDEVTVTGRYYGSNDVVGYISAIGEESVLVRVGENSEIYAIKSDISDPPTPEQLVRSKAIIKLMEFKGMQYDLAVKLYDAGYRCEKNA